VIGAEGALSLRGSSSRRHGWSSGSRSRCRCCRSRGGDYDRCDGTLIAGQPRRQGLVEVGGLTGCHGVAREEEPDRLSTRGQFHDDCRTSVGKIYRLPTSRRVERRPHQKSFDLRLGTLDRDPGCGEQKADPLCRLRPALRIPGEGDSGQLHAFRRQFGDTHSHASLLRVQFRAASARRVPAHCASSARAKPGAIPPPAPPRWRGSQWVVQKSVGGAPAREWRPSQGVARNRSVWTHPGYERSASVIAADALSSARSNSVAPWAIDGNATS